jgi:hypothetical protein
MLYPNLGFKRSLNTVLVIIKISTARLFVEKLTGVNDLLFEMITTVIGFLLAKSPAVSGFVCLKS